MGFAIREDRMNQVRVDFCSGFVSVSHILIGHVFLLSSLQRPVFIFGPLFFLGGVCGSIEPLSYSHALTHLPYLYYHLQLLVRAIS